MKKAILFIITLYTYQVGHSQCEDNGNQWTKSWTSCEPTANPNPARGASHWILYEFTQSHFIDSSHIWNANRIGESPTGIKDIIVDYSADGSNWIELGNYTIPQATESTSYQGVTGPNFGSTEISKVLITVLSTHNAGSCASISEIAFGIDASQCHGIIDECGVCDGPGAPIWYIDADGDGIGSDSKTLLSCDQPFGYVENNNDLCDYGQLGWQEIFPIFEISCKGCHIDNTSGGLNLGSYESFSSGGLNCGDDISSGSTLVDVITINEYDGCSDIISFPAMNARTANPISQEDLYKLQRWIDAGAPESCLDFCPDSEIVDESFLDGTVAYRQTSNEISSSAYIESNTLITFDAGQEVFLDTGFTVMAGGQLTVQIDGCQ